MTADVEAVEDDEGVAVCAVELEGDVLACVLGGEIEDAAVPAHAGLGIFAAEGMKALAHEAGVVDVGELDGPVMRKIDTAPVAVIEGDGGGRQEVAGLLEVAGGGAAVVEVFGCVACVAEVEAPAEVEKEALAEGAGSGSRSGGGRGERAGNL